MLISIYKSFIFYKIYSPMYIVVDTNTMNKLLLLA